MWSLLSSRVEASVSCPKMQSLRCTGGQSDLFDGGNVCSMCSWGVGTQGRWEGTGVHTCCVCVKLSAMLSFNLEILVKLPQP